MINGPPPQPPACSSDRDPNRRTRGGPEVRNGLILCSSPALLRLHYLCVCVPYGPYSAPLTPAGDWSLFKKKIRLWTYNRELLHAFARTGRSFDNFIPLHRKIHCGPKLAAGFEVFAVWKLFSKAKKNRQQRPRQRLRRPHLYWVYSPLHRRSRHPPPQFAAGARREAELLLVAAAVVVSWWRRWRW